MGLFEHWKTDRESFARRVEAALRRAGLSDKLTYDQAREYRFEVEADNRQEVPETDEGNNAKGVSIAVSSASSSSTQETIRATPDPDAVAREKTALIVHPGYKKYAYQDIFSLNIPEDWQNLAADAKGNTVTLGTKGADGRYRTLEIMMEPAGQAMDEVLAQQIQFLKGQVFSPARSTVIGHYPARAVLLVADDEYRKVLYLAVVGAPNYTFVILLSTPAGDDGPDIFFEAATVSFRTPATCGQTPCPELLALDARAGVVGTPLPPLPTPSATTMQPVAGAITVFFTITPAGSPWGYVTDKQGNRHAPENGILTVSGISTSPGDRIVLQTDAARFSLLFDCSTSPQSFSPCDFSADSPANLPAELRVNQAGQTGYLNISKPDNWAGYRSGFAPQRYPADPVLRIVLGD